MREGRRGKKPEMAIALLTSSRFCRAKKTGMKKRLADKGESGKVLYRNNRKIKREGVICNGKKASN